MKVVNSDKAKVAPILNGRTHSEVASINRAVLLQLERIMGFYFWSLLGLELLLQRMQDLITRQHAGHAAVGLTAFADGGERFAVLQLDAVHADIAVAHVDFFFLAAEQIVVAGNILNQS